MNYIRSISIGTRAIMPLLIIQFLLGMALNLIPSGPIVLSAHIMVATLLLALSVLVLVFASLTRNQGLIVLAMLGSASIITAFLGGVLFLDTGNNIYSYIMAVGFILAFVLFGTLTGRSIQALHQQNRRPLSTPVAVPVKRSELTEQERW